jgi:hypothetical protein
MSNCLFCKKEFEIKPNQTGRQIYCSGDCRLRHWRINHPDKIKIYQTNQWEKIKRIRKPKLCLVCNKPLENRRFTVHNGNCRKIKNRQISKNYRNKAMNIFNAWKLSKGCFRCKFNEHPAALCLHHLYGKDFRILGTHFLFMTEKTRIELAKCIVLCANCHSIVHHDDIENSKLLRMVKMTQLPETETFKDRQ